MTSGVDDEDEFPSEIIETKHKQWHGNNETLKSKFLRLMRIRDFLSLILTYPMTISEQHLLRKWIDDAQALTAKYFKEKEQSVREEQSSPCMHLLSEKPLMYVEGLIPKDIEGKIEDGQRSIFNENGATLLEELVAPTSKSKGKQVLELTDANDLIPKTILNIATDHAVNQLIQTLLTCKVNHIKFSTKNDIDTVAVMRKLEAALIDEQTRKKINHRYSRVLWIVISKYWSNAEAEVRHEIAQQLNIVMTREYMTEDEYEILLTRRIEEEMTWKTHLVILVDRDINQNLDPQKMGFPRNTLTSVLVLITINSSVQENDESTMATDLEIRTEDHVLPWELFCRIVGTELVSSSSAIGEIAVRIVEESRGHLLAILLVAKWLKNVENVELWKLALDKLRYPNPSYDVCCFHGVSRVLVYAFINFIWDGIEEKLKHCLTQCLSIPGIKDRVADHLLMSSWLYNKLVYSREEAECILRELADRSILLQLEGRFIQLPEEAFNVLKSLLKLGSLNEMRQDDSEISKPANTEEWHGAKQIELADDKLLELPPSPKCPELEVLLLQSNFDLTEIPPLFFCFMPQLLVLDLSYTNITSLPSSFFNLKAIKRLHLLGCKCFRKVPPEIGQLENLEILDLDGTPIVYLPEEIKYLTKLQKLTLTFFIYNHQDIVVPLGVITKLTQLSYLSIDVIPSHDELWVNYVQVILQELSELQGLITLILHIPQAELLKSVPECRYLDFRFVVGHHMQRIISLIPRGIESKFKQSGCSLKFVNGENIPNDIYKVLGHTNTFFLERHMNIKHLSEFELKNLEQLRVCIVGECDQMQTLIDEVSSYNHTLPYLEFLCFYYMNNLRSICQRKVLFCSCFCRLKTIALHNCPELTTILTMNFLDNLSKLEEIIVEDCPKVSTLISVESFEAAERIFLPSLRKIALLYLPEFVSISSGLRIGPSLEKIGFCDCPKLQSLSARELSSQNLNVIKAEKEWWDALKWEEAEWGKGGKPNYLDEIFFPINEKVDIMDQLVRDDYESSRSTNEQILVENFEETSEDEPNTEYSPPEKVVELDMTLEEQQPFLESLPHKKRVAVLKVNLENKRMKSNAMDVAAGVSGVELTSVEKSSEELRVTGDFNLEDLVHRLSKECTVSEDSEVSSSSPSNQDERWCEGERAVLLKKRRVGFEMIKAEEQQEEEVTQNNNKKAKTRMKTKMTKKFARQNVNELLDGKFEDEDEDEDEEDGGRERETKGERNAGKKRGKGSAVMEGSRCSRVNGRGWRCCQQTVVGYTLCEHHLGKGRRRSITGMPEYVEHPMSPSSEKHTSTRRRQPSVSEVPGYEASRIQGNTTRTTTSGELEGKGMIRIEDEGDKINSLRANRWPRQETLALLKIRSDMDAEFRDSSVEGPLWEKVSRKLGELGYKRSAKKCKEKFENVYKYRKRIYDTSPSRKVPGYEVDKSEETSKEEANAKYLPQEKSIRSTWPFPAQHDSFESLKAAGIQGVEVGTKLYVSNLDHGVTSEDIRELYSEIGDLKRYAVHYDRNGHPSGSAEVVYTRRSDAFAALKRYNNVLLDGKPMKIEIVGTDADLPVSARGIGVVNKAMEGSVSKPPISEGKASPEKDQALRCPRCDSTNTKFCYFNNYSLSRPRHFCKSCRRYWTRGGALRNVPVGGGARRSSTSSSSSLSSTTSITMPLHQGPTWEPTPKALHDNINIIEEELREGKKTERGMGSLAL